MLELSFNVIVLSMSRQKKEYTPHHKKEKKNMVATLEQNNVQHLLMIFFPVIAMKNPILLSILVCGTRINREFFLLSEDGFFNF